MTLDEMTLVPHPAVERGVILVNPRDFEDAFTRRPTRTDYERGQMLKSAAEIGRLIAEREKSDEG